MSMTISAPARLVLPDRRTLGLRLAAVAAGLALLGLAALSLPGLDDVGARLSGASPAWLGFALILQAASCLAFVAVFRGVFSRHLPWRLSYEVAMAAQGTNVLLPAGGASGLLLGGWALGRTGMPATRIARRSVSFFLITSSVNFVTAVVAGAALALGVLPSDVGVALTAGPAGLAALTIACVLALPRALPRWTRAGSQSRWGRWTAAGGAALVDGITDARTLVRSGHPGVVGGAIGYMALDLLALAAAFQAVGHGPGIGVLALAYVVGQLGGLVPVPGGIGGADGGLIAVLVLYGSPLGAAAAAVLAYRVFQLGLPAVLGAIAVARLPGVLRRAPRLAPA